MAYLLRNKKKLGLMGALGLGLVGGKLWTGGLSNKYNPDQTNKIVIVTGGNAGIGKATARQLYNLNAQVIITGRNAQKAQTFIDSLPKKADTPLPKFYPADFSDLKNIEEFAQKIIKDYDHIDLLVNNAGAWNTEYKKTKQDIEFTMGVNHVAPVYLTSLLYPLIKKSEAGRVVNVASEAHAWGIKLMNDHTTFPNLNDFWANKPEIDYSKNYNFHETYGWSKIGNVWFTQGLKKRLEDKKVDNVRTYTLHPGNVNTEFFREWDYKNYMLYSFVMTISKPFLWYFFRSEKQGAQTILHCSLAPTDKLVHGAFYDDCRLLEIAKEASEDRYVENCWEETAGVIKKHTGHDIFDFSMDELKSN